MSTLVPDDCGSSPLEAWELFMLSAGHAKRTVRDRVATMRPLERHAEKSVDQISAVDVSRFLARPELGAPSRTAYASSIRRFYCWYARNGGSDVTACLARPKAPKCSDIDARGEALRKPAKAQGLRLVRSARVFTLHRGAEVLHQGDVDDVAAYLRTLHPGQRPGGQVGPSARRRRRGRRSSTITCSAWLPPTTLTLRRIQLVRMARDLGGSPTDVTGETLVAWFGAQTGWKTETRRNYRAAVRAFWRGAYRTRRVPDHLADELPKVRERWGAPRPPPNPEHAALELIVRAPAQIIPGDDRYTREMTVVLKDFVLLDADRATDR
jgi:hypothetical protein